MKKEHISLASQSRYARVRKIDLSFKNGSALIEVMVFIEADIPLLIGRV